MYVLVHVTYFCLSTRIVPFNIIVVWNASLPYRLGNNCHHTAYIRLRLRFQVRVDTSMFFADLVALRGK